MTAQLLEELQFTLNEGACIQAATSGTPVLVADMHHSSDAQRWPIFAAAVIGAFAPVGISSASS
jgi:hypothetical protein